MFKSLEFHRNFWNGSEYYRMTRQAQSDGFAGQSFKRLVEILETVGTSFLDVGCGSGVMYKLLKEKMGEFLGYKGIDVSPEAIKYAQRHFPEGDFELFDSKFPLEDKGPKVSFTRAVFEHVELDDIESLLKEMARVSSVIVICWIYPLATEEKRLASGRMPIIVRAYGDIKAILDRIGLEIDQKEIFYAHAPKGKGAVGRNYEYWVLKHGEDTGHRDTISWAVELSSPNDTVSEGSYESALPSDSD